MGRPNPALPPRHRAAPGLWTLPAGYLELNETTDASAAREALEEACAEIAIEGLLAVYSVPRISQIQLIYRARLVSPNVAAGEESLEVGLFRWEEIPWKDIAFPSVHWALNHFRDFRSDGDTAARTNPPGELGNATPDGHRGPGRATEGV